MAGIGQRLLAYGTSDSSYSVLLSLASGLGAVAAIVVLARGGTFISYDGTYYTLFLFIEHTVIQCSDRPLSFIIYALMIDD